MSLTRRVGTPCACAASRLPPVEYIQLPNRDRCRNTPNTTASTTNQMIDVRKLPAGEDSSFSPVIPEFNIENRNGVSSDA